MNRLCKIETLFTNKLLIPSMIPRAKEEASELKDPVGYCISQDFVQAENFYPNLAAHIAVPYVEHLPVPLSPVHSVSQFVPPYLLIEHRCFLYLVDETLHIAIANPYMLKEHIDFILSFTAYKKYKLVLSNPTEVQNALSHIMHLDFTVHAEKRVETFNQHQSARSLPWYLGPRFFLTFSSILILSAMIISPLWTVIIFLMVINTYYFIINPLKFYGFLRALFLPPLPSDTHEKIQAIPYRLLPIYTILVPLRNEGSLVPTLIETLLSVDYPKDKLDIKFIVDVDDSDTIRAFMDHGVGRSSGHASLTQIATELVRVPLGAVSTKPRACNYALSFARGKFTVIYDAEDVPEFDQLRKSYQAFAESSLNTICLQAKLNFYNKRQNLLTRFFTLEYYFWFDYFLKGLQTIGSPLPLGGTSNHFLTDQLKRIGSWDAFNVTEDADLGLRIFRKDQVTGLLDSYTYEEANSRLWNWLRQRTRWQKGFLQTFLVHIAHPVRLIKEVGLVGFIYTIVTFGSNFFLPLSNPILWVIFLLTTFPSLLGGVSIPIPSWVGWISLINLTIGNLIYISVHAIAVWRSREYDLIPYAFIIPFYWVLISIATYRALIQYLYRPYYWEKTQHGLSTK